MAEEPFSEEPVTVTITSQSSELTVPKKRKSKNSASVGAFKPTPDLRMKRKRTDHKCTSTFGVAEPIPPELTDFEIIGELDLMKRKCRCTGGCCISKHNCGVQEVVDKPPAAS